MTERRLTARGRGPDARVTFSVDAYRGKVCVMSFDCPAVCEAILEPTQADRLVELINQTTKEAREYKSGPTL